jgi:FlgD Ig-like domain
MRQFIKNIYRRELMKRNLRFTTLLFITCIATILITPIIAFSQPNLVFVFNDDDGDNFNENAKSYIFQELGLVDANGHMGVRSGDNIVDGATPPNVLGTVIKDGDDNVIGYRSLDGTKEAYDVNSSYKTKDAFARVAKNGTLHIIKHGTGEYGNPGGGIHLDKGKVYDGFRTGTGTGTGLGFGNKGYTLTPRPGANITVNLNSCNSKRNPAGTTGPVTGSLTGIDGVGPVEGHEGKVYIKLDLKLVGGTAKQKKAALEALRAAAREAGFPPAKNGKQEKTTVAHIAAWLLSIDHGKAADSSQKVIDKKVKPAGTVKVKLTYSKGETAPTPSGSAGGGHCVPVIIPSDECGSISFPFFDLYYPTTLTACPGDLTDQTVFEIDVYGLLPAAAPPGYTLASGCYNYQASQGGEIIAPLTIDINYWGAPQTARVFWFDPVLEDWTDPCGEVSIDAESFEAVINSEVLGTYAVFQPEATIKIEKTHNTIQGQYELVSITLENSDLEMGGFDFLIAYDASALTFIEATPGQLLDDCGWEYFTYRYGVHGNCGDACPSGLLRIIAIAETNDGPHHPSCFGPPDTDPHELAEMKFFVTDDRTYNGQYVPIYFFWDDCGDNMVSSVDGDIVYHDRAIFDFEFNLIWDEEDDDSFPEDDRIPFVGAPDFCLNPDPDKPPVIRLINFIQGGIDIAHKDSLDLTCDINLDEIPYTIADAVLLTNYFIYGPSVFTVNLEGQLAATDCNNDGKVITIGDLTYLIRVITADAVPFPKMTPYAEDASVNMMVNHSAVAVSTQSMTDIGAGYFEVSHSGYSVGEPYLINGAADLTLKYADVDGVLKVVIYSMEPGLKISAGKENVFVIPIVGSGEIDMVDAQLSDYYGNMLNTALGKSTTLPDKLTLHQNYPNPFNAVTQISYELPSEMHVKIEIYNMRGQKVTTLIDGVEAAGVHNVEWNSTDQFGNEVASGVYIYRLTTDSLKTEKKLILMK